MNQQVYDQHQIEYRVHPTHGIVFSQAGLERLCCLIMEQVIEGDANRAYRLLQTSRALVNYKS